MSSVPTERPKIGPGLWPWHPFLIGLGWVAAIYTATGPNLFAIVRVVAVVLLSLAMLVMLLRVATRSWQIAGIAATALLAIVIAPDPVASLYMALGIIFVTSVCAVAKRISARWLRIGAISQGLNVIAGIFLVLSLLAGVGNGTLSAAANDVGSALVAREAIPSAAMLPDVYVVVLDGYPRADTMHDRLGSSAEDFIGELERRGFEVADGSTSGYMYSYLAFTSMFHGRHLVDIPGLASLLDGADMPAIHREVLNRAPKLQLFRDHGYLTIANAQAWEAPSLRNVDVYVEGSGLNEFERYILSDTLIGAVWELIDGGLEASLLRPWVTDAFAFLERSPEIETPQPRLVFVHIPSPHFPIIFAADGTRASTVFAKRHPDQVEASDAEVREAYVDQVEFLNRRLIETLDAMRLPEDAVVILMSDHGPEFGLDWLNEAETEFDVRLASFFAARNADGAFRDDVFVTEILPALARELLGEPTEMPERRFFSSHGREKITSLTEIADPWR